MTPPSLGLPPIKLFRILINASQVRLLIIYKNNISYMIWLIFIAGKNISK